MPENFDYKAYMASLGEVESNQKNIIKDYLEKQCEKDEALKALYRAEKIDDCYKFIENCARTKGNEVVFTDEIVFKMARDYFIEVLPKIATEAPKEVADITPTTELKEVSKEMDEDIRNGAVIPENPIELKTEENDDKVYDEYGFEIWGEKKGNQDNAAVIVGDAAESKTEPEVSEKVEEVKRNISEPKKEPEIEYDEYGNGLFAFEF